MHESDSDAFRVETFDRYSEDPANRELPLKFMKRSIIEPVNLSIVDLLSFLTPLTSAVMQRALMNPFRRPHPKTKFSPEEDELLTSIVREHGSSDWHRVARLIPGRNARQCRDRWLNYLSPDVGNGPWSPEEEVLLLQKHGECGAAWKHIASCFVGRTDINVKSRWLLIQRRMRKAASKSLMANSQVAPAHARPPVPNMQPLPPPPSPVPCAELPAPEPLPGLWKSEEEWDNEAKNEIWRSLMMGADTGVEFSLDPWL
jgi:hypothetical protein